MNLTASLSRRTTLWSVSRVIRAESSGLWDMTWSLLFRFLCDVSAWRLLKQNILSPLFVFVCFGWSFPFDLLSCDFCAAQEVEEEKYWPRGTSGRRFVILFPSASCTHFHLFFFLILLAIQCIPCAQAVYTLPALGLPSATQVFFSERNGVIFKFNDLLKSTRTPYILSSLLLLPTSDFPVVLHVLRFPLSFLSLAVCFNRNGITFFFSLPLIWMDRIWRKWNRMHCLILLFAPLDWAVSDFFW